MNWTPVNAEFYFRKAESEKRLTEREALGLLLYATMNRPQVGEERFQLAVSAGRRAMDV